MMTRVFFLGFVRIHILHHAAHEPVYGVALIEELARHGYQLSPGTLYPLLHGLEAAGYLCHEPRVVDGKQRKYYTITARGREALDEARARIRQLVDEVLEEDSDATDGTPAEQAPATDHTAAIRDAEHQP